MSPVMAFLRIFCLLFLSAVASAKLGPFNCSQLYDMHLTNAAFAILKLTLPKCAEKCVADDKTCDAFHHSGGTCYLLNGKRTWSEQASSTPKEVCIKHGFENPACTAAAGFSSAQWGRSRYALVKTHMTWPDAAKYCKSKNSKLVQATSPKEFPIMKSLVSKMYRGAAVNSGMHQMPGTYKKFSKDANWIWHRSGDLVPLKDAIWKSGEPNDALRDQRVGAFDHSTGLMEDNFVSVKRPFICECFII